MNTIPAQLFTESRTIAVVGLSPRTERVSYGVAEVMQQHGYRIIPVNPTCAGSSILGEHCYASLIEAHAALQSQGIAIDMVDCFRKAADIPPIVDEAIKIGAKTLWMQLGIRNDEAAAKAKAAGMNVVMDSCLKVDYLMWRRATK